jgi:hypothetical protein
MSLEWLVKLIITSAIEFATYSIIVFSFSVFWRGGSL